MKTQDHYSKLPADARTQFEAHLHAAVNNVSSARDLFAQAHVAVYSDARPAWTFDVIARHLLGCPTTDRVEMVHHHFGEDSARAVNDILWEIDLDWRLDSLKPQRMIDTGRLGC